MSMPDSGIPRRVGRPPGARFQSPEPPDMGAIDPGSPEGLVRVRRRRRVEDPMYIDPRKIPPHTSYEWKRFSCFGQPDHDHQVNLRENGWTPVPAERHPEMMPTGHTGHIEKRGQILMQRPAYLTQEAHDEDYGIAMEEVERVRASQMGQTPTGHFSREHPSARRVSGVKVSYGPAPMTAED